MKTTRLGRSGPRVASIGQGTMGMGGYFERSEDGDEGHIRALRTGIDLGMTLIDTAEVYGAGHAEELVGQAISGRRHEVVLMTKFSAEHSRAPDIVSALEGSLRRLGTEYVDIYQPHWPNPDVPFGETLGAIDRLIAAGKVRAAGLSNFDAGTGKQAISQLQSGELACMQNEYNLVERTAERDLLPFCAANDVALVSYSPYQQGKLLKRSPQTELLFELASQYGIQVSQIILAWLTRTSGVVAIPKASTEANVRANAQALEIVIDTVDLERLSTAFDVDPSLVPCDQIDVVDASDDRTVYRSVEQALANPLRMSPSPRQLADEIIASGGRLQKPVKLRWHSQSRRYSLVEGRLKYWAWVIAYGIESPIPALIEDGKPE